MYLKELGLVWEMQCWCYSKLVLLHMSRMSVLYIVLQQNVRACVHMCTNAVHLVESCLHVSAGVYHSNVATK